MASRYEYSSYSSSSRKGDSDSNRLFDQVDTNNDGVIDKAEFAKIMGGTDTSISRTSGTYGSSSYESHGYSTGGIDVTAYNQAASYTADSNAAWSRYGAEVRGVGLYYDPNPEIRRVATGGVQTHTQKVQLRFLQPPPVAASGALIIKEVRAASLPVLPPLRIIQQEVSTEQLPPLILREKPPVPPTPLPSETIVRTVAAFAPKPRSVIIERHAAASARPRDIIIERWLPYPTAAERETIVQRDETVVEQSQIHNVIIEYGSSEVRVVRDFENLGVTRENPQAYYARYGAQLLDTETLLQQARAAGVFEDLSAAMTAAMSSLRTLTHGSGVTYTTGGGEARLVGLTGEHLGGGSSTYTTRTYQSSSGGGVGNLVDAGYRSGLVEGGSGGYTVSTHKSSTYSSSGGVSSEGVSGGFSNIEAKI